MYPIEVKKTAMKRADCRL